MMNTLQEFIDGFVSINYQEDQKAWGYNPYHYFVTGQDGHTHAGVLIGMPSSEAHYAVVAPFLKEKPKNLFLAMDFPPVGDISTDFVAIFSYIESDDTFECTALPYDVNTGNLFPLLTIDECPVLVELLKQFLMTVAILTVPETHGFKSGQ